MKKIEEKFIKTLFTSCLIIALVKVKEKLEFILKEETLFLYLFLFLISLFIISIVEYVFEKLDELSFFRKIFFRKDFIEGWWLNRAINGESKDIYNFALIEITYVDDKYLVNGRGFKVISKDKNDFVIMEDGHFHSTVAQYKTNGELIFNFTITDSGKVASSKHQIFGKANYYFVKDGSIPVKFSGNFSTDDPHGFCSVIGNRLDNGFGKRDEGIMEDYNRAVKYAIQKKWIDPKQIK